jgi:NitT/TauT family transport system substrate-binding protein
MKSAIAATCHSSSRPFAPLALLVSCAMLLALPGCGDEDNGTAQSNKVKVCYIGLTCEPPIYVAYEMGFFKEEGLDVELVKTDWDSMRDGLGLGRFDATHTLIMYMLNPIDRGLDIKLTGGIHSGCLRIQSGINTDIETVKDLKGKRIGISHMGSPPFLFASRVLAKNGIDPQKEVEWVIYPSDSMELALDQGQVDAVANSEPIGTILLAKNKVRKIVDQGTDQPYSEEFCCVTALNGTFAANNPKAAAGVTRALLKAAKWVDANKTAAAKLAVDKGYLAATPELNVQAIREVTYRPAVRKAEQDILQVAKEMKAANFLNPNTDPAELTKRAWLDLEGTTDDWIEKVEVDKIAGGGDPPQLSAVELAALIKGQKSCCFTGCCGDNDSIMSMFGAWAHVKPRILDLAQEESGTELVQRSH